MAGDQGGAEGTWLLQPLGPDEVRFKVDVGEGVVVSDELRDALDKLLDELLANEVDGFLWPKCPELKSCSPFTCQLGKCQPLDRLPCFSNTICVIQTLM